MRATNSLERAPDTGGDRAAVSANRRAAAGPALAVVLALIAAGCGSAGSSGGGGRHANPAVALARAADVSATASGERVAFSMSVSSPSLPAPARIRGSGSFQLPTRTGQLTLTMNLGGNPAAGAALGGSTVTLKEVLERDVIYVKLPSALSGRLPGARPWLEVDLAGLASGLRRSAGLGTLLDNPLASNPAAFLQYLRAESGRVQRLGTATIDGEQTTEYHAVIDLRRVASLVPPSQRAAVSQTIATLEKASGLSDVPIDAWVDASHRVRRLALSFTESPAGQRIGISMTINVLAYGPQPAPQIPPASQVTNITTLLRGLAAGSPGGG
jgi:hypothetical protein